MDVKKAPAIDQTETLPFDIMQAVPDDSLPSSNSPTIPSSELREQYQNTAQPKESPPGANVSKESWAIQTVYVNIVGCKQFIFEDCHLKLIRDHAFFVIKGLVGNGWGSKGYKWSCILNRTKKTKNDPTYINI